MSGETGTPSIHNGQERNGMSDTDDLRDDLAMTLADAADDGCFHPQGDAEMWDANEEDRSYWLRLSDSLMPVVHAFATEQSEKATAIGRGVIAQAARELDEARTALARVAALCDLAERQTEATRMPSLLTRDLRTAISPAPQQDGGERP